MTMQLPDLSNVLSGTATDILQLDAPSAYRALVVSGGGNDAARGQLEQVSAADLFVHPPRDVAAAEAALAGLWLWHDWLDLSHAIAQKLPDATGSFWHAVMH